VVAPGVPCRAFGDTLLDGDLFSSGGIGDANIDGVVLEIVDGLGGVALVPGDFKWGGAVLDAGLDEGIGESYVLTELESVG
jgi:hypothetical protein